MSTNGAKSNEDIKKREKSSGAVDGGLARHQETIKVGSALTKRTGLDEELKANIVQWATRVHSINCKTIVKEYPRKMHNRFLPVGVTFKAGETYPNYHKFRYSGEKCNDQTRVVLKNRGKDSDFIHANWVGSSAPGATKYICTQAPLKETQEDFWHMCFTEKASLILMLCNYTEGSDFETSSHYFPEKENETRKFGAYTVTMKEKLNEPEIEKTEFTVMEIKCKGETVTVKHCFMRYWLDICPPVETEPILKLWRWVRKYHNNQPVVVLCAAGVGRAPTFAGIELAAHRIASKPEIDMMDVVKELRKQRFAAITSTFQFLYLHYLVLDYFVQEKLLLPHHQSLFVEEYRKIVTDRLRRAYKKREPRETIVIGGIEYPVAKGCSCKTWN